MTEDSGPPKTPCPPNSNSDPLLPGPGQHPDRSQTHEQHTHSIQGVAPQTPYIPHASSGNHPSMPFPSSGPSTVYTHSSQQQHFQQLCAQEPYAEQPYAQRYDTRQYDTRQYDTRQCHPPQPYPPQSYIQQSDIRQPYIEYSYPQYIYPPTNPPPPLDSTTRLCDIWDLPVTTTTEQLLQDLIDRLGPHLSEKWHRDLRLLPGLRPEDKEKKAKELVHRMLAEAERMGPKLISIMEDSGAEYERRMEDVGEQRGCEGRDH